jgi:hypothetical protein
VDRRREAGRGHGVVRSVEDVVLDEDADVRRIERWSDPRDVDIGERLEDGPHVARRVLGRAAELLVHHAPPQQVVPRGACYAPLAARGTLQLK